MSHRLPSPLSIALLHRIAREGLPLILTDDPDVEVASELVIAGHLKATMQVVLDPRGGGPQTGVVIREITRLGKAALQHEDLRTTGDRN